MAKLYENEEQPTRLQTDKPGYTWEEKVPNATASEDGTGRPR